MSKLELFKRLEKYVSDYSDVDVNTRGAIERGLHNEILELDVNQLEDLFFNLSSELDDFYLTVKGLQ